MKQRTTVIVITAAAAAAAAAFWTTASERRSTHESTKEGAPAELKPFLPGLAEKAASIASITVKRPEMTFTIVKGADGGWRMPEKADYPVKAEAVRQAILGLTELREWEPKTNLPDKYNALGVEDPVAPPVEKSATEGLPQSTLLTLKDSSGAVLADVIIGNQKWSQSQSQAGVYVRRNGETQSWLARGTVETPREQLLWLDAQFANIDRARVKSATIDRAGTEPIVVSRDNDKANFAVSNVPAGREIKDANSAESIATAFTLASFQDVGKADSIPFGAEGSPAATLELRTFDGLVINANLTTKEAKQWLKPIASVDEEAIKKNAAGDEAKAKTDSEKIHKEADDLNAKWSPYVFAPVDFKARSLNTTLDDLLKPLPPAPGQNQAPAMPPPPGSTLEQAPKP